MKLDCSDLSNFVKERNRRYQSTGNPTIGPFIVMTDKQIEEAIKDLQSWSDGHPQKTYLDDFKEKFPNARIDENGIPYCCLRNLRGNLKCLNPIDCFNCWNQIMEENK